MKNPIKLSNKWNMKFFQESFLRTHKNLKKIRSIRWKSYYTGESILFSTIWNRTIPGIVLSEFVLSGDPLYLINDLSNSTIVIKPRARYPRQRIRRAGNDAFGPRQNAAADHSTLQMFCLLNPQMFVCEPNPKTTSSDFYSWKSVTKIFCFHAISTDICLLF